MPNIIPFNGVRYNKTIDINTVICPPYDIITFEDKKRFVAQNEYNIVSLEKPEISENGYKGAAALLKEWLDKGILVADEKKSIYIYEMEYNLGDKVKKIKGYLPLVELSDFSEGKVLPHEKTFDDAKKDRFDLMSETFCNFSCGYALYDSAENEVLEKYSADTPLYEVKSDGVINRLWAVTDEDAIKSLQEFFAEQVLYIADGHHRYTTAVKFKEAHPECCGAGYMMLFLVNMKCDGLTVFPGKDKSDDPSKTDFLLSELKRVTSIGEVMPQKSTYFYPKPITGLVINDFNLLCENSCR
ncbi:MAG: DUF1015 domain-containing protein [Ruminococcus sp.]|jgi:uncharacterized protein (DUF1015 family)|nr:DUF1015 domain-containing protein [Ruminococcus sp.]